MSFITSFASELWVLSFHENTAIDRTTDNNEKQQWGIEVNKYTTPTVQ